MFPNVIVPFLHLLAVLWLIVLLCGDCHFVFFVQLLMAFYFGKNQKGILDSTILICDLAVGVVPALCIWRSSVRYGKQITSNKVYFGSANS